jgi:hypothetical protein
VGAVSLHPYSVGLDPRLSSPGDGRGGGTSLVRNGQSSTSGFRKGKMVLLLRGGHGKRGCTSGGCPTWECGRSGATRRYGWI